MYEFRGSSNKSKTTFPSNLNSGKVIQRDIGFEVEVKNWRTWKPATPQVYPETILKKFKTLRIPHAAKEVILKGEGFELTADRPTNESVPEFVTTPEPETPEGLTKTLETFKRIEKIVDILHQKAVKQSDMLVTMCPIESLGQNTNPMTLFDASEKPDFHPQANVGLKLSKIPEIFLRSGDNPPSCPSRERLTRIRSVDTKQAREEMMSMKSAQSRASEALRLFFNNHRSSMPFSQPSPELVGLCALMIHYMECPMINYSAYVKSYFPIMARTDFAGIFELLPHDEQTFFRLDNGKYFLEIFAFGKYGVVQNTPLDMSELFFAKGVRQGQAGASCYALDQLTREQWIRNIPAGVDMLTRRHYPGPDEQKNELDTIGSWANCYDKVGKQKQLAPIFELRRLQYTDNTEELSKVARDVFLIIMSLNRDQ
ncbi:hypothetical protein [Aureibacter tunicatorum]|uniref:Uncharacterized protein n=1 Tax=Aureibacter tunicatorum TaxID=866807 RepID=A0AAE4BSD2_9BACT|nr:hypothetical protein [Aureibacter tunicatorum]MDR6238257.1 hypothetical protein [Aureibacter tunicatorum]BDD03290.1 hypothetical protein AUTU_07730 [Aureibacter tunicatorum]